MTDEANSSAAPAPTGEVPQVTFELNEFQEGDAKGFKFNVPVYAKVADAVAIYGEALVVAIVNSSLAARIRTKVKNDLGLDEVAAALRPAHMQKKLATTGGILFSEQDARSWRPDVREVSSKQMFKTAVEILNKEYPLLLAQGKMEEASVKMQQAQDLMKRAAERATREAEEAATAVSSQTPAPASASAPATA